MYLHVAFAPDIVPMALWELRQKNLAMMKLQPTSFLNIVFSKLDLRYVKIL